MGILLFSTVFTIDTIIMVNMMVTMMMMMMVIISNVVINVFVVIKLFCSNNNSDDNSSEVFVTSFGVMLLHRVRWCRPGLRSKPNRT
jgi:hypothetical protein